jgi:hypothetical protein
MSAMERGFFVSARLKGAFSLVLDIFILLGVYSYGATTFARLRSHSDQPPIIIPPLTPEVEE